MPRHTLVRLTTAATSVLVAAGALTGCTTSTTAAPQTTVTKTVTAAPASTPAPTIDVATALRSAPVPAACRHPAGTLADGILPGQAASTGSVELASLADTGSGPYEAQGAVDGIDGEAVAATIACNAGGVPWPDVLVVWKVDGSSLSLVGGYSLGDFDTAENAVTQSVVISGGVVTVDWTGPADGQPAADGSLKQSARFTAKGDSVVATDYTATTQ